MAVKKLPQFAGPNGHGNGEEQPCSEGMYLALLREIELASKFSSDRWGVCLRVGVSCMVAVRWGALVAVGSTAPALRRSR